MSRTTICDRTTLFILYNMNNDHIITTSIFHPLFRVSNMENTIVVDTWYHKALKFLDFFKTLSVNLYHCPDYIKLETFCSSELLIYCILGSGNFLLLFLYIFR